MEIGTLAGYSTICIARAIPESGSVTTIELDEQCVALASDNFIMAGLGNKIRVRQGEALEVLSQLEKEQPEPFDFFFLDAHKPSYIEYFEWAIAHSHPGSLIVADSVIRDGDVIDASATDEKAIGVRKYNSMLSERSNVQTIIIPNISGNGYDGTALSIVL